MKKNAIVGKTGLWGKHLRKNKRVIARKFRRKTKEESKNEATR
jgi:hypothetical protein